MFLTVLSGVIVFVISQFILKLILEPIVNLKEVFGLISSLFLREQSKITNCVESDELRDEFRKVSSLLLSKSYSIPFYERVSKLLKLPTKNDLLEVSRSLNHISYCVTPGAKETTETLTFESVHENMKIIAQKLKVPVSYAEL